MKLTTDQKKQLKQLENLGNKLKMQFAMHQIKTWRQFYHSIGHPAEYLNATYRAEELDRAITFPDIKQFLVNQEQELNHQFLCPFKYEYASKESVVKDSPTSVQDTRDQVVNPPPALTKNVEPQKEDEEKTKDYGLPHSDKEVAKLFWFQRKAAAQLLRGLVEQKKKAQLLIAGVGTGKTFILGAFFRRLVDMNFKAGKSISPWPYIYITRASIVEQTKRVFDNSFGLKRDVMVINIEQLRSKFGELFVDEEMTVVNGEEKYRWFWRPHIFPLVTAIDECQAAKNNSSTQSQIIQSMSRIEAEHIYTVWLSATPFTRVCEAKAFVLNARLRFENMKPTQVFNV